MNKNIVILKGEDVIFYGDSATENLAAEFCGKSLDVIEDDFPYEFETEEYAKAFEKTFKGLIKKKT